MIFNDYDHTIMESNLEVLDYVIESAKFEISNGNNSYMAVYEAAANSADKANENWIGKVINKIKTFCKSLIAKAKMILNRLATKFRLRKAVKMKSQVYDDKFSRKGVTRNVSDEIKIKIASIMEYQDSLDEKTSSACMKFVDSIRNGNVPKSKDDFMKSYLNINSKSVNPKSIVSVDLWNVKKFIDNAVKYLTNLSNSTADVKKCNETLKQSGKSASESRYGISTMYNFLTAVVKEYYENAMNVSKYFMDNATELPDLEKMKKEGQFKPTDDNPDKKSNDSQTKDSARPTLSKEQRKKLEDRLYKCESYLEQYETELDKYTRRIDGNAEPHKAVLKLINENNIRGIRFIISDALDVDPEGLVYAGDIKEIKNANMFDKHIELTPFTNDTSRWDMDYWVKLKMDITKNMSLERWNFMKKVAKVFKVDTIKRLKAERLGRIKEYEDKIKEYRDEIDEINQKLNDSD